LIPRLAIPTAESRPERHLKVYPMIGSVPICFVGKDEFEPVED
jgi:hypothetical protein